MPTDDERREVARRLRAIEPDDFGSYSEEHECVEKILGTWDDCDKFLWRVVADLIEPSEPKVKCIAEVKIDGEQLEELVHDAAVELTGIDRDALLALSDICESTGNVYEVLCSESGDGAFYDLFRKTSEFNHKVAIVIRNALGVVA